MTKKGFFNTKEVKNYSKILDQRDDRHLPRTKDGACPHAIKIVYTSSTYYVAFNIVFILLYPP